MPIHDQSYRHWEGTFKSHSFRWWVITREGLRIILRRKVFLIFIMAPPIIQFLIFGAIVYGVNVYGSLFNLNIVNPKFFFDFLMRQTFFLVLICIFGGSGLLANDLKNNALQLYFSKPLTRIDYLVGKFTIIMVLMAFLTLVPGIILFAENSVISEGSTFFKENYWLLGSIVLQSFILMVPTGLLILALSSVTKNSRYTAISFIAILMGTPIFSQILRHALRIKSAVFISYWENINILGKRLFRLSKSPDNWYWAIFIILGIIGVCIWTMYRKINGVEIVK